MSARFPRRNERQEDDVRTQREAPDFSAIRSPMERAEAERGYEVGVAIGEGLYAAGEALARAINGVARIVARRAVSDY